MSFESGVTYNRGGCTLKHCWERISEPRFAPIRIDLHLFEGLHRGSEYGGRAFKGALKGYRSSQELRMKDERLLIVHFMGGSKGFAPEVLCTEENYTGEPLDGYGCRK